MSETYSDSALEAIDYSDAAYSAGTNYVDLYVYIPPAGVNTPFSWSAQVDGNVIQSGSFNMVFSSGPQWYYLARVYVPYGKTFDFNSSGGDTLGGPDTLTFDLGIGKIPVARIKDPATHTWKHAIPWVKSGGVWQQAVKQFVHDPSGWVETTG